MSMPNIHIAYGSESGNAHALAIELKDKLKNFTPALYVLDELSPNNMNAMNNWTHEDILLVVTSTTGNGEAPFNAARFYEAIVQKRMKQRMKADTTTIDCRYAVFGIGNVNYENFCGFSKVLDGMLGHCGATSIAKRVDADIDYEEFFEEWSDAVLAYLSEEAGSKEILENLTLQVDPDA